MTALIVGCGDIGRRVAQQLITNGTPVTGIARNAVPLHTSGIPAQTADLDEDSSLVGLRVDSADLYLFSPPPPKGKTDPRMARLLNAITNQQPRKIVYISTPSVYGDCGGEWIDESQTIAPLSDRGHRRADAEQQLQQWCATRNTPLVILRVPGIYGPGRLPIQRLLNRTPMVRREESPYTNRIHADDLANIAITAMQSDASGVFHASDGQPSKMTDYFDHCAEALHLQAPPKITLAEAQQQLSPGLLGYLKESKRLKNDRLKLLGITLQYPNLKVGLIHCVNHFNESSTLNAKGRG